MIESNDSTMRTAAASAPRVLEMSGRRSIRSGAVSLVIGVVITVFTYAAAAGGGVYIVAWGPMVYGLYRIVSGLRLLNRSRR